MLWAVRSWRTLQRAVGPVIIERTGTGYSAYSPDVAGCVNAGRIAGDPERTLVSYTRSAGSAIVDRACAETIRGGRLRP